MSIKVLRPGMLTSIQDTGRYGYQAQGVIVSGSMDSFSSRLANILIGNQEKDAVLEITLVGPRLQFESDHLVAICGADLSPKIDGMAVPLWRPLWIPKGSILEFGRPRSGCRSYLAIAGGIDVPPVMGSKSTYLRANIGGYHGRCLKEGDQLGCGTPSILSEAIQMQFTHSNLRISSVDWSVSRALCPSFESNPTIRIIRGPQFADFTENSILGFTSQPFLVTPQSDRMGYRLEGPPLQLKEAMELISEPVTMGTIQVPPGGNPIVLMADRQTTGGYPRIGYVSTVDMPLLAQVKPGEFIRFVEISLSKAQELYLEKEKQLKWLKEGLKLMVRGRQRHVSS